MSLSLLQLFLYPTVYLLDLEEKKKKYILHMTGFSIISYSIVRMTQRYSEAKKSSLANSRKSWCAVCEVLISMPLLIYH